MKPPSFWYDLDTGDSPFKTILLPFSRVYARMARRHRRLIRPKTVPVPVICIGNLTVGGNGKTPCAMALYDLLTHTKICINPFFLTRGYGGKITGPEMADKDGTARIWGDETLMLARKAPTVVAARRHAGAMLAHHQGADAVILDDGLQHHGLYKNISFCVIDGATGFGNGAVMPAGPLRQKREDGFDLCDAFIIIGDDARATAQTLPPEKPVFRADIVPVLEKPLAGDYVAFCGIGLPEKFRATLEKIGVTIVEFHAFDDHHPYTEQEIQKLQSIAAEKNARLITTEKDAARLSGHIDIDILPVRAVFADPEKLSAFIADRLS